LLALAFLLSGTCALAYQVVWARMLSLLFGSTNQAIATVLAVFMLGLALGSHFGEKVSRRGRDLGRAYGLMEMALGLFALCFPFLIARMGTAHALAFSLLHQNETLLSVARFGIAFALLIIPTALMGATLPVLAQHVEHDRSRVGSRIGALYAINTFGAALGDGTAHLEGGDLRCLRKVFPLGVVQARHLADEGLGFHEGALGEGHPGRWRCCRVEQPLDGAADHDRVRGGYAGG